MSFKSAYCIPLFCLVFIGNSLSAFAKNEQIKINEDNYEELISRSYILTYKDSSFPLVLDNFLYQNSTLVAKSNYHSEIENPYYCLQKVGMVNFCDLTQTMTNHLEFKRSGKIIFVEDKLKTKLEEYSKKINKEPINGKLKMAESGQVAIFTESQPGLKLDIEKSIDKIKSNILDSPDNVSIALVVDQVNPEVQNKDVNDMGINQLIAHGESNFRGSTKNRIHNINTALKKFDGLLIKPGEEFSFTTILGPVDGENGYTEELVIKKNETVPEFGGGVCQVSTTMFRAALNGGLEITERHNHAYPVQYYAPQGTDATIYVPKPDLRFKNDTPAYILMQTKIEGTILSINFYGTSDGRKVELVGPKVIEKTAQGQLKTTLKQVVNDSNGNLIREAEFRSFYDNPDNYHKEQNITQKPGDWSKKQWDDYKRTHQKPQN